MVCTGKQRISGGWGDGGGYGGTPYDGLQEEDQAHFMIVKKDKKTSG